MADAVNNIEKFYRIKESDLKKIGDAIRFKNETTDSYTVAEMPEAIKTNTGGAAYIVDKDKTILISGTYQGNNLLITENTLLNLREYLENYEVPLDIQINVQIPEGYLKPEGTFETNIEGTYDVTPYANATFSVQKEELNVTPSSDIQTLTPSENKFYNKVVVQPIPSDYVVPSGTLEVTENGEYDVSNYALASVNVTSGGGGLSPLTKFPFNNPNLPNCYHGQYVFKDTKIKIDFGKLIDWLDQNKNEAFANAYGLYDRLDIKYFAPSGESGSGSGSGSGGNSNYDWLYNSSFDLFSYIACETEDANDIWMGGMYFISDLTFGISVDYDDDNGRFYLHSQISASDFRLYFPEYPIDGDTVRTYLRRIGNVEFCLKDIEFDKASENVDYFFIIKHFLFGEKSDSARIDLNKFPIDWLEFVNE